MTAIGTPFGTGTLVAGGNSLTTVGFLTAVQLTERMIAQQLVDTADLFGSPVIRTIGDVAGAGSTTLRDRMLALGWATPMTATAAEDTDVAAQTPDGIYADVTVARRAIRVDETQLAQIVGGAWGINPEALATLLVDSFRAGRMDALGTLVAGATTNITSGSTGTVDDLLDVVDSFTAAVNWNGPLVAILHPFTKSSIRDSIRGEVGPYQQRPDLQAYIGMGAEDLLGIACFPTLQITNAGGYHENAVCCPGAIAYAVGSPSNVTTNVQVVRPAGLPVVIDFEVYSGTASVHMVANGYDGQAIREQARIRGLLGKTS